MKKITPDPQAGSTSATPTGTKFPRPNGQIQGDNTKMRQGRHESNQGGGAGRHASSRAGSSRSDTQRGYAQHGKMGSATASDPHERNLPIGGHDIPR